MLNTTFAVSNQNHKMKKNASLLLTAFLFLQSFMAFSQILEPVKWRFSSEKIAENEHKLLFTADIDPSWSLYSQDISISPPATRFHFEEGNGFELIGEVIEPEAIEKFDPNFDMVLKLFNDQVVFHQKVRLTGNEPVTIKGFVTFMSCDDMRCMPPIDEAFSFKLTPDAGSEPIAATGQESGILQPVTWDFSLERLDENRFQIDYQANIDEGWELYSINVPENGPLPTEFHLIDAENHLRIDEETVEVTEGKIKFDEIFGMDIRSFSDLAGFRQVISLITEEAFTVNGEIAYMVCNQSGCIALYEDFVISHDENGNLFIGHEAPSETELTAKSEATAAGTQRNNGFLWATFFTGILGGLLALLTPCVFPMIPITVSFFLRNAGNRARAIRDASFYGFTIIFAYVVLGLAISLIFGANALNALATNPWFNIFFFALLVFFAASFFGAFELTMPSSWTNALDSKADQTGGVFGVVLMGLTFVLVSFSCTGPIVGTLLVEAATSGDVLSPAIGMLGFSLALAIPFSLFAVFPTALQNLPKSGGWMNSIKVVLGFIVLAFALKFLGTADAVAQWGILDREVFIVLWIAIFMLLGLYLIGKIKFAHDSDLQYLSVPRLIMAILAFAFVFYLLPGLWGAPLRAVSSFLPSPTTQDFDLSKGVASMGVSAATDGIYVGKSVKEGPHGLMAFTDYEEGLAAARKAGKPIFLDFTGLGCVNCRKMEANVWSDPAVMQMLANDFVKISLFVDDRTPLPEHEQFVSSALGRERTVRTVGQKWSVFQAKHYGANTQPYYVILDHDEEMLVPAYSYDTSIPKYLEFLNTGKNNFGE